VNKRNGLDAVDEATTVVLHSVKHCGMCPFMNTDGTGSDVCWLAPRDVEVSREERVPGNCPMRGDEAHVIEIAPEALYVGE
jgi:hypothetical protein